MNCHRVKNRILDLPPLTPEKDLPQDIQRHLDDCPICRNFFNEHFQAARSIRPSTPPAVPPDFKNRLIKQIKADEIKKDCKQSVRTHQYRRWKPAYATALALLILFGLTWFEPHEWLSYLWNHKTALPADLRLVQAFASEFPNRSRTGVFYQSREITFRPVEGFFGEEQWYPIGAINERGDIEYIKVSFTSDIQKKWIVKDESWYDFDRGEFIRTLSLGGKTFYVNAFNDNEIVLTDTHDPSNVRLRTYLLEPYALPQPEEFLNLASSLSALWANGDDVKIVHSKTSRTYNGQSIQQIKSTLHKKDQNYYRYYFNFTPDNNQIFEINSYIHRDPLLTIHPHLRKEEPPFPRDLKQIALDFESVKRIQFEKLDSEPYIRTIDFQKLRDTAWDGLLYADPDPSHFPIAQITDFFDFSYPSKRTIAILYEAPDASPVLILQSVSLNQRYGVKIEAISRPSRLTNEETRVWEGPILDAATKHIVKALQPVASTFMNNVRGYLLKHTNESYALLITSESIPNQKIDALIENLSPFVTNSN